MHQKECMECGKAFITIHMSQKFCSWACVQRNRTRLSKERMKRKGVITNAR